MVKHIVMWSVAPENKKEIVLEMKKRLESLVGVVPEIIEFEVGINYAEGPMDKDIVLYSVFNSKEDLNAYQANEDHLKVAQYIRSVITSRCVVDYEC